jgi:hypothetical protein
MLCWCSFNPRLSLVFVAQIPLKVAHGQVLSLEQVGSAPSSSSFSGSISVEGAEKFTSLETAAIGKFVPQFSTHVKGFLRRGFLIQGRK